ncbi:MULTISPECIES: Lrp/AsnC family transcriptional regulator [Comamonadaceae]|uniref:Lrp/AsnC family transcriptional regulator n=1 Tax=unclassified Acidovorax TaxID=2684926 RepID=UPI0023DE526C|nr:MULTISPECIES: Lrp/AsnC family transcriptional regulator [Comamonadaceae]WOI44725.1 Lrp/AsnC family transcriptional regulator [Paracidovorax avenae]GKS84577.1 Lrp/AsnC family transcriptional regulator [Acidovorax sp. SUPP1855]GKS92394.1 Lrp/AsnC family transcriptional regulator [Acidovorax sp. SUPP2539]GKS95774.1 Lrp/AsnC family transcriptional regulator [Acidovorax sp. SUPP2825]GKS98466.1 Lrp/AsnC family transcriptional regulator [Acidovorax sp. SUPP3434]
MKSAILFDRFDLKILAHLQREGRCSNVDLAKSVGLSPSPCLLRTKRLQEIGLIRGYSADIALEKLGDHVIVFSEVTIGSHRPHDFRKFEEGAGKYQEIVECYNVSGGYDYLLKIVVSGIGAFQALMEKMLEDDIGIERFACRIVLRQPHGRREYPLGAIAARQRWE